MTLTRAQLSAIDVLANGPARVSNRNDDGRVAWRTVQVLEEAGLAIDVAGHRAVLTDTGKAVAADPPDLPPITRDHGTYACYVLDQCRCDRCRKANSDYEARRVKDAAYGRPRMVEAGPVRDHVRALMASGYGRGDGVGLKQIAKVSGVSHGSLWKLVYGAPDRDGPSRHVRADTADALLVVSQADRADGSTVPAGPTAERLAELRDAGATWVEIAEQVDRTAPNLPRILTADQVTVATARAVHDLWSRWQDDDWTPRGRRSPWPTRRANQGDDDG